MQKGGRIWSRFTNYSISPRELSLAWHTYSSHCAGLDMRLILRIYIHIHTLVVLRPLYSPKMCIYTSLILLFLINTRLVERPAQLRKHTQRHHKLRLIYAALQFSSLSLFRHSSSRKRIIVYIYASVFGAQSTDVPIHPIFHFCEIKFSI